MGTEAALSARDGRVQGRAGPARRGRIHQLLVATTICVTAVTGAALQCAPGFSAHQPCADGWSAAGDDKCYKFFTSTETWAGARQNCVALGGDLATPSSQTHQDVLDSLLTASSWIGANDRQQEDSWRTAAPDGAVLSFTKWCGGEPNDSVNEDCGEVVTYWGPPCWNDEACSDKQSYVCEKDVVIRTTRSALQAGTRH